MSDKKMRSRTLLTLNDYFFNGKSVKEIMAKLQSFYSKQSLLGYKNIIFKSESQDNNYSYEDIFTLCISGEQLETNEEYNIRISRENRENLRDVEHDRQIFNRLKKQYGW